MSVLPAIMGAFPGGILGGANTSIFGANTVLGRTVSSNGGWFDTVIGGLNKGGAVLVNYYQTEQAVNAARYAAEQAKYPPVSYQPLPTGVQGVASGSASSNDLIMYGALGLGALFLMTQMQKGGGRGK